MLCTSVLLPPCKVLANTEKLALLDQCMHSKLLSFYFQFGSNLGCQEKENPTNTR